MMKEVKDLTVPALILKFAQFSLIQCLSAYRQRSRSMYSVHMVHLGFAPTKNSCQRTLTLLLREGNS
jgi:hypothetical protein